MNSRRDFIKNVGLATAGFVLMPSLEGFAAKKKWFNISLAEWSLHRTLHKGDLKNIDFPEFTAKNFGIYGVEYVNTFFMDKAKDMSYLKDLNNRSKENGVKNVLIMIDGEGELGHEDARKRAGAIENHYKWIDAASFLGCTSIRVNVGGNGTPKEVGKRAAESLSTLSNYSKKAKINVIVENHGGISSNGAWLADVLKAVDNKYCGSLPDFGNFYDYDRYQGVIDLMPYAKGVSAKAHDFDANGNEVHTDYVKIMEIVKDAGYRGFVGIEYEGDTLSEIEGIKATKALLERFQ